jgi:hypothetical protein
MTRVAVGYVAGLVMLAAASVVASDMSADAGRVQADARRLLDATYAGDVETVMALTHPALIEQLGSREEARRTYSEAMARLKKIGLQIDKFEFPEPPRFVAGKGRTYAIIPIRLVVSAGEQTLDSRGFQVGVSDPIEKKWTYVEGAKFDAALRAKYFADFPKDFELPDTSRLE